MTSRFIVIQPSPATTAAEVSDDLAAALSTHGSVQRVDTLAGTTAHAVANNPEAALAAVVEAIRALEADTLVIEQTSSLPFSTFDSLGWSLDVAASTGARVIVALDAEGIPLDLIKADIEVARLRAHAHQATLSAVAIPGAVASQLTVPEVLTLPTPLDAHTVSELLACPPPSALTPLAFQADLIDRARANKRRIVLPEPEDDRVLTAAAQDRKSVV